MTWTQRDQKEMIDKCGTFERKIKKKKDFLIKWKWKTKKNFKSQNYTGSGYHNRNKGIQDYFAELFWF